MEGVLLIAVLSVLVAVRVRGVRRRVSRRVRIEGLGFGLRMGRALYEGRKQVGMRVLICIFIFIYFLNLISSSAS